MNLIEFVQSWGVLGSRGINKLHNPCFTINFSGSTFSRGSNGQASNFSGKC